jgi:ribosomal protein L32E
MYENLLATLEMTPYRNVAATEPFRRQRKLKRKRLAEAWRK